MDYGSSSAMLDQLIEKTYNDLIRSFPPTSSYSLQDLSARDIAPDLYRYLSFVLEKRSEDAINNLDMPESAWFDASGSDVSDAWSTFVLKLKRHPVFPANTWASTLHDSVEALTTYAMTPVQGMEQILYGTDDSLRASLAEGKLLQLKTYPVIVEAAQEIFHSADDHFVRRDSFREALTSSIHRMTSNYSPEDWEQFAEPVFRTAAVATGGGSCPLDAVTGFFDDLGLREHANRIHNHAIRYKLTELDSSQLYDALIFRGQSEARKVDLLVDAEDVPVAEPSVDSIKESESDNGSPVVEIPVSDSSTPGTAKQVATDDEEKEGDEPAPLWKKFQKKLNAPVVDPSVRNGTGQQDRQSQLEVFDQPVELPPHRPEEGALSDYSTAESPSVPIWERFRDRASTDGPVSDFSTVELRVLGESVRKNRQRFITNLFNGSHAEYEEVIRRIDKSSNWDEASLYIADAVFRKHRVNIYSELAVSFTNAVEQRYRAIQAD